ncbi:MAG TPA: hypothetical protein VFW35_05500 [Sphingomicrobium sp.]|nr:hypothetical protein [Sphingomicrobium sp.]
MIVCTLSACATYGNSIGVSELKARHSSLTSRIVQVHGWLTPCGFRSCLMVESRDYGVWLEQAGALERRMDVRGETSVQFPPPPDRRSGGVSFGSSWSFDRQVAKLRHSLAEVVVEARVTDECWSSPAEGKIVICGDRANQLEPIRLVKVIQEIPLPSDPEEY